MRTNRRRWSPRMRDRARRLLAVISIAAITAACAAEASGPGWAWATPDPAVARPSAAASPATQSSPTPSGLASAARRARPRTARVAATAPAPAVVPILYYHRVQPLPEGFAKWPAASRQRFLENDILPVAFAAQLDWLQAQGYTTILPRDLATHWDYGTPLPERPVMITFDDGSHDWMSQVLPMLEERGMVAEFYLTLDAIAHGNLTWKQVRRLAAAGNGIGAHDVHHVQLAAFGDGRKAISKATMWSEVSEARRIIGENVGVFPDSMAYVGGGYDDTLVELVRNAGYTTARSIVRGLRQTAARRFTLRVVRVGAHDDVSDLMTGTLVPGMPRFAAVIAGVQARTR
jgi:peptidoglycan/xylan/chitin deacetylase (PgdA/CDA1 family)